MVNKVEISHRTIFFTVLFILAIFLIFQIKEIILLIFVSFILMSALSPAVEYLEKYNLPRPLAIMCIYIILLSLVGIIGTIIIPPLVYQSVKLAGTLPEFINSIVPNSNIDLNTLFQQIIPVGEGVVRVSLGLFSNVLAIVTLLVVTFYLLLDKKKFEDYLADFIGKEAGKQTFVVLTEIETKLGAWVRGELILMSIIGLITYIGLLILRVDYALPLAIFAGLLEIVPIIGPIVSAIPAVLVALSTSWGLAVVVITLYTLIQQFENHLIVPTVMRRAVGLPPLVTILALMVGSRLAGVGGALLSVPIVVILQVLIRTYLKIK